MLTTIYSILMFRRVITAHEEQNLVPCLCPSGLGFLLLRAGAVTSNDCSPSSIWISSETRSSQRFNIHQSTKTVPLLALR